MCSPGQLSGSYAIWPKAIWDKFGSERLSICTETSNHLSKKVITSPKLGPKLSQLTTSKSKRYFIELLQVSIFTIN